MLNRRFNSNSNITRHPPPNRYSSEPIIIDDNGTHDPIIIDDSDNGSAIEIVPNNYSDALLDSGDERLNRANSEELSDSEDVDATFRRRTNYHGNHPLFLEGMRFSRGFGGNYFGTMYDDDDDDDDSEMDSEFNSDGDSIHDISNLIRFPGDLMRFPGDLIRFPGEFRRSYIQGPFDYNPNPPNIYSTINHDNRFRLNRPIDLPHITRTFFFETESQSELVAISGKCRKIIDFNSWMCLNYKIEYFQPAIDHFVTFFSKTVPYKYIDPVIVKFNGVPSKDILSENLVNSVKQSFTYTFLVHMWRTIFVEANFTFPKNKINQMDDLYFTKLFRSSESAGKFLICCITTALRTLPATSPNFSITMNLLRDICFFRNSNNYNISEIIVKSGSFATIVQLFNFDNKIDLSIFSNFLSCHKMFKIFDNNVDDWLNDDLVLKYWKAINTESNMFDFNIYPTLALCEMHPGSRVFIVRQFLAFLSNCCNLNFNLLSIPNNLKFAEKKNFDSALAMFHKLLSLHFNWFSDYILKPSIDSNQAEIIAIFLENGLKIKGVTSIMKPIKSSVLLKRSKSNLIEIDAKKLKVRIPNYRSFGITPDKLSKIAVSEIDQDHVENCYKFISALINVNKNSCIGLHDSSSCALFSTLVPFVENLIRADPQNEFFGGEHLIGMILTLIERREFPIVEVKELLIFINDKQNPNFIKHIFDSIIKRFDSLIDSHFKSLNFFVKRSLCISRYAYFLNFLYSSAPLSKDNKPLFKLIDKRKLDSFIKASDEKFPDSFIDNGESMCLNFKHYDIFDNSGLCNIHPGKLVPLDFIPFFQIIFYLFQSILDLATDSAEKNIDKTDFDLFAFCSKHKKGINAICEKMPSLIHDEKGFMYQILFHEKNNGIMDFEFKKSLLRKYISLRSREYRYHSGCSIRVNRSNLFHDSLNQLMQIPLRALEGSLRIEFKHEEGYDAGGLLREWYLLLSREILNRNYALFSTSSLNSHVFQPNQNSSVNEDHLHYFKFVGRFMGKAIYDNQLIDAYFTRSFYKHILGKKAALSDLESIDSELYNSLVWMKSNSVENIIFSTFSIEIDRFGEKITHELIPDGQNINVDDSNKLKYIDLLLEYYTLTFIKEQTNSFLEGFYEIIPKNRISIFNEQELEFLMCGLGTFKAEDLQSHTRYQNTNAKSPIIKWFWSVLASFTPEERSLFLQFVWGTSRLPSGGFAQMQSQNGENHPFTINLTEQTDKHLPASHTCFNQLDLPRYSSSKILREKLLYAIRHCNTGFELR